MITPERRASSRAAAVPPTPAREDPLPDGEVRVGSLLAIPGLLRRFGADPQQVFARAGIDLRLFDDPENRMTFAAGGRLFDGCVEATGCMHFGLLVGRRYDDATLGILGELLHHGETVGASLRRLVQYLNFNDGGAVALLLTLSPTRVALGYSIYHPGTLAPTQIYDMSIAIGYNVMRRLCGPSWQPLEVTFAHAAPPAPAPFTEFFGRRLRFDAELTALHFAPHWLKRSIPGADPSRRAAIEQQLRDIAARGGFSLADRVRRMLHSNVFAANDSAPAVARQLGLHERTLRRHLAAEGTNLKALAMETRFTLACHLLRETRLPLSEIAATLHFSDASAFSRAFRGWAEQSPRDWRTASTSVLPALAAC